MANGIYCATESTTESMLYGVPSGYAIFENAKLRVGFAWIESIAQHILRIGKPWTAFEIKCLGIYWSGTLHQGVYNDGFAFYVVWFLFYIQHWEDDFLQTLFEISFFM